MKVVRVVLGALIGLIVLVVVGLQIKPRPLSPYDGEGGEIETMPLPAGLPAPVARFYRTIYGNDVPVITSAVISGRGPLRVNGITFPSRFRFTHQAGQGYRHYIEATIFGLPLLKVNERYVDGESLFEMPFGTIENDPNTNQGANLALWAEAVWYPSVWVTDPDVRWEPIDDETAVLVVPFGEEEQHLVARFDPETGRLRLMSSMRYKGAESVSKTLWLNEAKAWDAFDGQMAVSKGAVTWFDEGTPWAIFDVEEIVLNSDVSDYILAKGE